MGKTCVSEKKCLHFEARPRASKHEACNTLKFTPKAPYGKLGLAILIVFV